MGTRSNVYVETKPGTYMGTYVHYDGYPSHMNQTLMDMPRKDLEAHIIMSMNRGGMRFLGIDSSGKDETEYLEGDGCTVLLSDPNGAEWGAEFVYIKQLDGTVKWRDTFDGRGWSLRDFR